jgi:hypothetical protein
MIARLLPILTLAATLSAQTHWVGTWATAPAPQLSAEEMGFHPIQQWRIKNSRKQEPSFKIKNKSLLVGHRVITAWDRY